MRLSFGQEYYGNCGRALDFYESVFDHATVEKSLYRETDMAGVGISGPGLDMIGRSELNIRCADSVLCMEMTDSLLTAMDNDDTNGHFCYHPLICLQHEDESEACRLLGKLSGEPVALDRLRDGCVADPYGMQWRYRKGDRQCMLYCLEFDGFCGGVLAFYESVFGIKPKDVVTYGDSSHSVEGAGAEMIDHAVLEFQHRDQIHGLCLRDSIESARRGTSGYDPKALLFYQGLYNPVFNLRDEEESVLSEIFDRLMDGGKINRPLSKDRGGGCGSLIDRYGICWNLNL